MNNCQHNEFQFECQKCGTCCSNKNEGQTYIEIGEICELTEKLGISLKDFLYKYIEIKDEIVNLENEELQFRVFVIKQKNGSCVFLQDKKCNIYEFRPFICRHHPFSEEILNNQDNFKKFLTTCKGFGKGKIYTEKEIKEKLKQDYLFHRKLYQNSNFLNSLKIEKILNKMRTKFEKENQIIEEAALELIKNKLLSESLSYYYQENQEKTI